MRATHYNKLMATLRHAIVMAIVLMSSMTTSAFIVDGIRYRVLDENKVAVARHDYDSDDVMIYTGSITIPSSVSYSGKEYRVVSISCECFKYCKIRDITLPETIETIEDRAFYGCHFLTSITIPASVKEIGKEVFEPDSSEEGFDDTALKQINVEPENEHFASLDGVLYDKSKTELIAVPGQIRRLKIPDSVRKIAPRAFCGCNRLVAVDMPANLQSIGERAFYRCYNLDNIVLPPTLSEMGESAFSRCESLRSIDLPDSLTKIPEYAFCKCINLETVRFGKNTTEIGARAFDDCKKLQDPQFPNSLETIEEDAFMYCKELVEIYLPDSLRKIVVEAFDCCPKLTILCLSKLTKIEGGFNPNWSGKIIYR